MKKRMYKVTAAVVAASLAVGGVAPVSALAATVPTAEVSVDSSIVTATAHRAASPLPEMLGANTVAGYGMINGSAPESVEAATGNFALEVWGTSNNVNPDPYWVNYYYKWTGGTITNTNNVLLNEDRAGNPIMADLTTSDEYGGVSVSLYRRPDILIGVSSTGSVYTSGTEDYDDTGYDSQIATITATGETYNPTKVAYDPASLDTMITTVSNAALAIKNSGKSYRYGDPTTIASDYAEYIQGIKGYIAYEIEEDECDEMTVAIVSAVNSDGTYKIEGKDSTASTSINRYVEYIKGVAENVADTIIDEESEYTYANVDSSTLAGVDAIIITSDTVESTIKSDTTIAAGDPEYISINQLETLYGVSMNSVENALGMGYILARIYDDSLTDLNVKYVYEYFASKFYHITSSKLDYIYEMAIVENITDTEETTDLNASDDSYSESELEDLFSEYAQYYTLVQDAE